MQGSRQRLFECCSAHAAQTPQSKGPPKPDSQRGPRLVCLVIRLHCFRLHPSCLRSASAVWVALLNSSFIAATNELWVERGTLKLLSDYGMSSLNTTKFVVGMVFVVACEIAMFCSSFYASAIQESPRDLFKLGGALKCTKSRISVSINIDSVQC